MSDEALPGHFTQRMQLILIIILLVALVGIGQSFSFGLYQVALLVLGMAGLSQIAVGNVPPDSSPARFFRFIAIYFGVMIALFGGSILLAPVLVNLGR